MAFHSFSEQSNTTRSVENASAFKKNQAGFTLTEMIGIVSILGLLASFGFNLAVDVYDKARLARCMVEVRGIQTAMLDMGDGGRYTPTAKQFWESAFPDGRKHGPYYVLTDGDPNKGHGNDLDGIDEENPGKADHDKKDIKFVVLCDHDHKHLAEYVYLADEEPPQLAHADTDPGYDRFIKWEFGGPGAK
jgi:type II secretory pathway pseudopilin PulG